MNRPLRASLVALIVLSAVAAVQAEEGGAPRGYVFFAPRNRASAAAKARAAEANKAQPTAHAVHSKTTLPTLSHPSEVTAAPMPIETPAAAPGVSQVTWGTMYGEGYAWPGPGPAGSYGTPVATPLHGYRSTYNWAGHTYSMHCYCARGYEGHCSGYRGECYKPCWNDAPPCGFEYRCRRGSPLDCLWHRGGYERPCRRTDCPYVCGTPQWSSYGFPPEAYGAATNSNSKPTTYYLPQGSSGTFLQPASPKQGPVPTGPQLPPDSPGNTGSVP